MKHINTFGRLAAVGAIAVTLSACSVMRGQEGMGDYASDTKITSEVKSKFAVDGQVAATAIGVETLNGVVQLSGFAKSQAEKDRASQIARQATGVKSVKNDIVVRP